ncbi:MAG: hypothetical protein IJF03_00295 [Lachnospiraceae bacterium]|nr:hypothetical protein [Lachnospiraceae bacterium]
MELDTKENGDKLKLELEGEKIVAIICSDEKIRETILQLLSGKNIATGECILNHISTTKSIKEYKKKVDCINPKEISSQLTVRNYLIFYGMVSDIYSEKLVEEFSDIFKALQMEEVLDKKVDELSCFERILVRCVAARLKKVELLLGNHILENKTAEEQIQLLNFLKQYFVKNSCKCILFENEKENIDRIIDEVMVIEDLLECRK